MEPDCFRIRIFVGCLRRKIFTSTIFIIIFSAHNLKGFHTRASMQGNNRLYQTSPELPTTVTGMVATFPATGTPTTLTNPEPSLRSEVTAPVTELVQLIYEGCGNSKGCFGSPNNCISRESCDLLVTFQLKPSSGVELELVQKITRSDYPNSYLALGLSRDNEMNDDQVFACIKHETGVVTVEEYYNGPNSKDEGINFRVNRKDAIMNNMSGLYIDGVAMCSFTVTPTYNVTVLEENIHSSFDLVTDSFFLLLARGDVGSSVTDTLLVHKEKVVAGRGIKLSDAIIIKSKSSILIQLHGTMMILAWILFASFGMFTARNGKRIFEQQNGVAVWFHIHRFCMTVTSLFTIIAFVLIFVENKGLFTSTKGSAEEYHPILGIVLTSLVVIQVFIAMFRPHSFSEGKTRVVFSWVHRGIGPIAHIFGIANIYFAKDLSKSNINGSTPYWAVLLGFIGYSVLLQAVIKFRLRKVDKQMEMIGKRLALRIKLTRVSESRENISTQDLSFRTKIFIAYALGAAGTAITLSYFAITAQY